MRATCRVTFPAPVQAAPMASPLPVRALPNAPQVQPAHPAAGSSLHTARDMEADLSEAGRSSRVSSGTFSLHDLAQPHLAAAAAAAIASAGVVERPAVSGSGSGRTAAPAMDLPQPVSRSTSGRAVAPPGAADAAAVVAGVLLAESNPLVPAHAPAHAPAQTQPAQPTPGARNTSRLTGATGTPTRQSAAGSSARDSSSGAVEVARASSSSPPAAASPKGARRAGNGGSQPGGASPGSSRLRPVKVWENPVWDNGGK
jgi:hypothetical protein